MLQKSLAVFDGPQGNFSDEKVDVMDTTIKVSLVSGAAGTIAASYAAALGANVATVTIGAAMTSIALPVVVSGAIVGAAVAWFKNGQIEKQFKQAAADLAQQIYETVRSDLFKTYYQQMSMVKQDLLRQYTTSVSGAYSEQELEDAIVSIEEYLNRF